MAHKGRRWPVRSIGRVLDPVSPWPALPATEYYVQATPVWTGVAAATTPNPARGIVQHFEFIPTREINWLGVIGSWLAVPISLSMRMTLNPDGSSLTWRVACLWALETLWVQHEAFMAFGDAGTIGVGVDNPTWENPNPGILDPNGNAFVIAVPWSQVPPPPLSDPF